MKIYTGIATSPGLVVAPVRRLIRARPPMPRIVDAPHQEWARVRAALDTARKELDQIEKDVPDQNNKDILSFQRYLLEDEGMQEAIHALTDQGVGAAAAVEQVGQQNADLLFGMKDNEYMQMRGADIQDAYSRVVDILDGQSRHRRVLSRPCILASDFLLPSDLAGAPSGTILGVATAAGGPQSHVAIIARSLGIPAISQLGADFLKECDGHTAAMDAGAGTLILDPSPQDQQRLVSRICAAQYDDESLAGLADAPCVTRDGAAFTLRGCGFTPDDIRLMRSRGASAVGTIRSEYLLLRGYTPGEEEQYIFYRDCLAAAGGLPVTIRTFDIGADQTTGRLLAPEVNPDLGLRGIRYSLAHPAQFEDQLCALLRAGLYGPLSVVLPMMGGPLEWKYTMQSVEHAKQALRRRGVPFDDSLSFGATLEVPAACLEAEALPPLGCRFFVIGLNDLAQYTHAADRNSSRMAMYYRTGSRAICRLIEMSLQAARQADIPLWVEGAALENEQIAIAALHMGVRSFALPVQSLLKTKQALRRASAGDVPTFPDEELT